MKAMISQLSNLHKIGKYNKEIGEIINKIEENRNFHIVSVDTESAPVFLKFYFRIVVFTTCVQPNTADDGFKVRRTPAYESKNCLVFLSR